MNAENPAISRLNAPLSLTGNFSWTLAGNVVYAGCQWAMLAVLAKLGTPGMVGRFVLSLAVTAPIIMFSNLQLRAVQATDARREYQFADYLGLRLVCTLLAAVAIIAVTFLSGHKGETAAVILAVGAAKAFESISDIYYGLLQRHERMDYIARSMMVKGPLSLVALATGSYVTGSIFWGACAMALVWGLVLVFYDIPVAGMVLSGKNGRTGDPKADLAERLEMFKMTPDLRAYISGKSSLLKINAARKCTASTLSNSSSGYSSTGTTGP